MRASSVSDGWKSLAADILIQAINDYKYRPFENCLGCFAEDAHNNYVCVKAFFKTPLFEACCELLDFNPDMVRKNVFGERITQ